MTESIFQPQAQKAKIRIGSHNDFVLIQFEKPVDYVQMTKHEAQQFAQALVDQINRIIVKTGDGKIIGKAN